MFPCLSIVRVALGKNENFSVTDTTGREIFSDHAAMSRNYPLPTEYWSYSVMFQEGLTACLSQC